MSTVVCHQALHDPSTFPVVESTTMRLKLVPPNRGFLESLFSEKPFEKKPSYVHPSSLLKLSPKSLDLCTESLGSETGNDTTQSTMPLYPNHSNNRSCTSTTQERLGRRGSVPKTEPNRKAAPSRGFPPPLTTITSLNLLQVRRHRESGRLIIQAVEAPPTKRCFRAERSHGRLRLTYWKTQDDDGNNVREAKSDGSTVRHGTRAYDNGEEDRDEAIEIFDDEVETEKQRFQWPSSSSRCKEDGHGDKGMRRRNWEPFWLATS